MPRVVKSGLIQAIHACKTDESLDTIREANLARHVPLIEKAGERRVFRSCACRKFLPVRTSAPSRRLDGTSRTEKIPDGPTTKLMQELAKRHNMVIIVPIYEEESPGRLLQHLPQVIDADGTYLGKYRKNHIPHVAPGFWEKFYFKPGNLGYPVFHTKYADVGVYICYDRHFPEGARELGLNGAEIVFNPSATVAGLSEYLWKLEQPAHAVANAYFVGAINRVGHEQPWDIGEFYGQSYFCDPGGSSSPPPTRDQTELVTAELDLDKIRECAMCGSSIVTEDRRLTAGLSSCEKADCRRRDDVVLGRSSDLMSDVQQHEVEVIGTEYAFTAPPELPAGRTAFRFRNRGKVPHEFNIVLLKPGVTITQFIDSAKADKPQMVMVEGPVGVLFADPGKTSAVTLSTDLLPGRDYAVQCIFRDSAAAPKHLRDGYVFGHSRQGRKTNSSDFGEARYRCRSGLCLQIQPGGVAGPSFLRISQRRQGTTRDVVTASEKGSNTRQRSCNRQVRR
jgi:N-carbamoylputrescine amidase